MNDAAMNEETMSLSGIKLLRKRYLPEEEVDISGDEILYRSKDLLVTAWVPIKTRTDISRGISYWFLDKGWKVSKIYNADGSFKYYYCDICRYEVYDDLYKMVDLLVDVIIDNEGHYKVVDFEELSDMLEAKKLPPKEFMLAIKTFTELITKINNGEFPFKELEMF